MKNSHAIGAEFEGRFIAKTGADKVPGSGSQWHSKLDARSGRLLWSLKRTTKDSIRVDDTLFGEMKRATVASGGHSHDAIGALCVSAGDMPDIVMMTLDDFMDLLDDHNSVDITSHRSDKRARADVPQLMRSRLDGHI